MDRKHFEKLIHEITYYSGEIASQIAVDQESGNGFSIRSTKKLEDKFHTAVNELWDEINKNRSSQWIGVTGEVIE